MSGYLLDTSIALLGLASPERISPDVRLAIEGALDKLTATPLPLRPDHISEVYNLQPIHQDPFDRVLIAQAKSYRKTVSRKIAEQMQETFLPGTADSVIDNLYRQGVAGAINKQAVFLDHAGSGLSRRGRRRYIHRSRGGVGQFEQPPVNGQAAGLCLFPVTGGTVVGNFKGQVHGSLLQVNAVSVHTGGRHSLSYR